MAKILFGWEFGGGLGHLTVLLPIARALARPESGGHEPVFVVKHPDKAARLFADQGGPLAGAPLFQAPRWPSPSGPQARAMVHSLADKLLLDRYHDAALLTEKARGWQDILRQVEPDLVVGDYAPTLFLAARGLLPTIAVGIPFGLPPGGRPLPPIRPWESALPAASQAAERTILQTVREVQARIGRSSAAFLGDLFNGDRSFPCTLPELDPYARFREAPTPLPVNAPRFGPVPPISDRPEGRVFIYLPAGNPHLITTLEALRELGLAADIFVPGLASGIRLHYASPALTFHQRPLALEDVLPRVRAIIHHGGHGTSYAALAAGTPQLLLVNNLERLVTGYGLSQLGCAVVLNADGKLSIDDMSGYLRRLLSKTEIHKAAERAAQSVAARDDGDPLAALVEACRQALAQAPPG